MRGEARPGRTATLFVLPYLLLGLVWLVSNPVAAAPDEDAHLVKALGVARLDIGVPNTTRVDGPDLGLIRNASITRVVSIPSELSPAGYPCFAFRPLPADCQPAPPAAVGDVQAATAVGAYPPFVYVPIGIAARASSSPEQAFLQGRFVVLAWSTALLFLSCWHLTRWLGPRALIGVALAMTPMAVFCTAILNTSGLEIGGAFGIAAVVAVATRQPESLDRRATQAVVLVSGSSLILSRQLGLVTMAALTVLLLAVGGGPVVRGSFRRRSPLMLVAIGLLALETAAVGVWELLYDHPVLLGPWASRASLAAFVQAGPDLVAEAIGWFGWLDAPMPAWATELWTVGGAALLYAALALGRSRDRIVIVTVAVAGVLVAFITYSRVFFPIAAGLQGRHMLPFFAILPILAGAILAEQISRATFRRVMTAAALVLPALQLYGLYINARRYAVPPTGPAWFVPDARWSPPLGWPLWLLLGVVACATMAVSWVRLDHAEATDPGHDKERVPRDGEPRHSRLHSLRGEQSR